MVLWVEAGSWVFGGWTVSTPCPSSHRRNTHSSHSSHLAGMGRRKSSSCNTDTQTHRRATTPDSNTPQRWRTQGSAVPDMSHMLDPLGKGRAQEQGGDGWRPPAAEAAALFCFIPLGNNRGGTGENCLAVPLQQKSTWGEGTWGCGEGHSPSQHTPHILGCSKPGFLPEIDVLCSVHTWPWFALPEGQSGRSPTRNIFHFLTVDLHLHSLKKKPQWLSPLALPLDAEVGPKL